MSRLCRKLLKGVAHGVGWTTEEFLRGAEGRVGKVGCDGGSIVVVLGVGGISFAKDGCTKECETGDCGGLRLVHHVGIVAVVVGTLHQRCIFFNHG